MSAISVADVGAAAEGLRAAGLRLRALTAERRAATIVAAARRLAAPDDDVVEALRASCGLSAPMVRWALRTTLETATDEALRAVLATLPGDAKPASLVALVLSGNVLTAPFRGIALPLLCGAPVLAKASSRDDAFARLFAAALTEADAEVGAALEVLTFVGGDMGLEDAMLAEAEVLSAYGSDETLGALSARLPARAQLLGHGHGLGVAYVAAASVPDAASIERVASAAAMDVAAYDQRGCLSPHAVFVEQGADARAFAEALFEALASLAETLPRGPLPIDAAAAQMQWLGVAAARGELRQGELFAVSFEGPRALRLSPGYRNICVLTTSRAELQRQLRGLGPHLKAVGVAGSHDLDLTPLRPRLSALGAMQTPPFDAQVDGRGPLEGLTVLAAR